MTETATVNVTVTSVNDPPVNTVPGATQTVVRTAPSFTGGSTISVADPDNNLTSATLTVTNGVLNASNAGGATVGGNGTTTVTVTGTQANINAALAALDFRPHRRLQRHRHADGGHQRRHGQRHRHGGSRSPRWPTSVNDNLTTNDTASPPTC